MAAKVKHERGAYWLVVHNNGKRAKRRFGPTLADKRRAEKAAEEIDHRIALGQYEVKSEAEPQPEPVPFDQFAEAWVRSEVLLPTEREVGDHLAPATARSNNSLSGYWGCCAASRLCQLAGCQSARVMFLVTVAPEYQSEG